MAEKKGYLLKGIFFLSILIFFFQAYFIFSNLFVGQRPLVENILITSLSLLAFLSLAVFQFQFPDNSSYEKIGNRWLISSVFLFFLGDFFWLLLEYSSSNPLPIGSWPDLVWNVGYIALIISLFYFSKESFRESDWPFYLIIFFSILVGGSYFYYNAGRELIAGTISFADSIQSLYPFYDIILFGLVLYLLDPLIEPTNRVFLRWMLLASGILSRIVFDLVFAKMSIDGTYTSTSPIDLIYVLYYVFISLSSLFRFEFIKKKEK